MKAPTISYLCVIRDGGGREDGAGGAGGGRACWAPGGALSYTRPPRSVVWILIMRLCLLLSLVFQYCPMADPDLHTVTAWPSLTPVLQKSPTFSPTQVRAMKRSEPAPPSPRLASASSGKWTVEIGDIGYKSLTNQIWFVLLQDEAVAGVWGTEGGGGGVPPAVRALCSAALTAVQGPACDRD